MNHYLESINPIAMNTTSAQICQSCSMPMSKPEDFGTNADGRHNDEYCHYCFQNGHFVNPDATMKEVIDLSVEAMQRMHMPATLIEQTKQYIPLLKRWQTGADNTPA